MIINLAYIDNFEKGFNNKLKFVILDMDIFWSRKMLRMGQDKSYQHSLRGDFFMYKYIEVQFAL